MKRFSVGLVLMLSCMQFSQAQITAPNWILDDCSAVSHNLYSYLDSQEVVVMAFVMGCSSCTDAGNYLMTLKNEYAISHPGKVNFFLMDYYPTNTCVDVNTTWTGYNFDAYFSGCWSEKEVYFPTLYPMPAVVIAAGNYHTVVFNHIAWLVSDTAIIKSSIDQFFNTVGVMENATNEVVLTYPNPAYDILQVEMVGHDLNKIAINVYDLTGKVQPVNFRTDKNKMVIYVEPLKSGGYILELIGMDSKPVRKSFIKY